MMGAYMIFGVSIEGESSLEDFWSSWDFTVNDLMVILLILCPSIKAVKNKPLSIALKLFMGIAVFKLVFDLCSFFYPDVFHVLNQGYEIGGILVITVVIHFIILKRYGRLVKR